jgi:rare lipoprotein A
MKVRRSEEMSLLDNSSEKNLAAFLIMLTLIEGCATLSSRVASVPAPKVVSPPSVKQTTVGEASWYGRDFNGKTTASGHTFDETKMTAAHRTLPLGSKAKVTNLDNGKSVEVEINDRGPYAKGRILDLSHAAAKALGIGDHGTARVSVEPLESSVAAEAYKKP